MKKKKKERTLFFFECEDHDGLDYLSQTNNKAKKKKKRMFALMVSEVGVDVQWCMCNCATPRMTFFLPISFFFLLWRSVTFFFFSAFRCNCLPRFFFFSAFFFFLCIAMFTVAVVFVWLFW